MSQEKINYGERRFPGQKPDEVIQLLVRKHWIIDAKQGASFLIVGGVPLLTAVIAAFFLTDQILTPGGITVMIALWVYLLFVMLWTYIKWLNEELDIIIITNERVISHDQVDLFHRQISETHLFQIQDVKGVEKGLLASLFHYGSLKIQTAAHNIVFEIQDINKPYSTARKILEIRDHYVKKSTGYTSPVSPVYNI